MLRKWLIPGTILASTIVLGQIGRVSLVGSPGNLTTVEAVRARFEAAPIPGQARPEVEARLKSRRLTDDSDVELPPSDEGPGWVIRGIFRDTDRGPMVTGSVTCRVYFDRAGTATGSDVRWVGTGP